MFINYKYGIKAKTVECKEISKAEVDLFMIYLMYNEFSKDMWGSLIKKNK